MKKALSRARWVHGGEAKLASAKRGIGTSRNQGSACSALAATAPLPQQHLQILSLQKFNEMPLKKFKASDLQDAVILQF